MEYEYTAAQLKQAKERIIRIEGPFEGVTFIGHWDAATGEKLEMPSQPSLPAF